MPTPPKTTPVAPAGLTPPPAPVPLPRTTTQQSGRNPKTFDKPGAVKVPEKKATLLAQKLDPKFTPLYTPLTIVFLTGAFKGESLDLGFNISELSSSQSADWSDTNEKGGIRTGSNFKSISSRTFNITLEYWADNDDVQQLVENNAYLHSLTDFAATPPLLQFIFGAATISPIVCTSFDPKYDTPLPKGGGFRHAQVGLTFKLLGGKGSVHQLAPPLCPTPLGNYLQDTTQAERAKQGTINAATQQLVPCLGKEGSEQVTDLIENNQLNDPEALSKLSSRAFIQLAASGGLSKKILSDPKIQEKLKGELALVMVEEENGSQNFATNSRRVARAITSGDPSGLSGAILEAVPVTEEVIDDKGVVTRVGGSKTQFELMSNDYQRLLTAFNGQDFNLDPNADKTAIQRLNNVASCGLQILQTGGIQAVDVSGKEAGTIAGINQFLADPKTTDAQIKERFGLPDDTPETVLRKLRRGVPYKSKSEFLNDSSYNRMGVTGYNMWNSFDKADTQTLADLNSFLKQENLSDDDIKKRFGVDSKEEIAAIRNGNKPFKSKEEFLGKIGGDSTGLDGKGNENWLEFQRSQPEQTSATPAL